MTPIRALLVDDEVEYAEALGDRLALRGILVSLASSGQEALDQLGAAPTDVVVLDVMMPGLSGIDTLIEMKKRRPDIPVIMLSGHADVETAIKGMEHGAFDYLVKPIDFDELLYRIEDAVRLNAPT